MYRVILAVLLSSFASLSPAFSQEACSDVEFARYLKSAFNLKMPDLADGWGDRNKITQSLLGDYYKIECRFKGETGSNYSTYPLTDIIAGFGRFTFKYGLVQEMAAKTTGDLAHLARSIKKPHLVKMPKKFTAGAEVFDYPTKDLMIALDYFFQFTGSTKDILFRGEIRPALVPSPRVNTPFTIDRYISTSLKADIALAFTDGKKLALKGYGTLKKLTAAGNVRVVTVLDCRHHPLKAIWMPAIYHSSSEQIDRSLEMEAEYLLPRNLRFVLKDRREFKDDIGPFFIELVEPTL